MSVYTEVYKKHTFLVPLSVHCGYVNNGENYMKDIEFHGYGDWELIVYQIQKLENDRVEQKEECKKQKKEECVKNHIVEDFHYIDLNIGDVSQMSLLQFKEKTLKGIDHTNHTNKESLEKMTRQQFDDCMTTCQGGISHGIDYHPSNWEEVGKFLNLKFQKGTAHELFEKIISFFDIKNWKMIENNGNDIVLTCEGQDQYYAFVMTTS